VDVDVASDITEKFKVQAMPTFLFLKDKEVVDGFAGASVEKLKDTINKHI
jgi:thioredoxin 1